MNRVKTRNVPRGFLAALALLSVMSVNCAVQPPGSGSASIALSGVRLHVLMQYRGVMNPNYHYYFLINNTAAAGSLTAPGPVAVIPGYNTAQGIGNGFASSSNGSTLGFTDYVSYNLANGVTGVALFHVPNANILTPAVNEGVPVTIDLLPTQGDGTTLEFDIDLAQLMYDSNGQKVTDSATIQTMLANMKYMQINIVSTNIVPTDQTTSVSKAEDAMGDGNNVADLNNFLVIDVTQHGTTYTSTEASLPGVNEPTGDDVRGVTGPGPNGDDPIDLISWSITPTVSTN